MQELGALSTHPAGFKIQALIRQGNQYGTTSSEVVVGRDMRCQEILQTMSLIMYIIHTKLDYELDQVNTSHSF